VTMAPGLRKLVLTAHLVASVGWVGAVLAYLALGLAARATTDAQTVRAAWIAMELTGWSAIVPLALASLATGLVMSLGTPWGLFRHYWVVLSLVLTLFAVAVLLPHMRTVTAIADLVRADDAGAHAGGHGGDLFHAGGGLLVLLAVTVLNVYKPRGLTPYGWRQQQEERTAVVPPVPADRTLAR
jgi:hypothetical protein